MLYYIVQKNNVQNLINTRKMAIKGLKKKHKAKAWNWKLVPYIYIYIMPLCFVSYSIFVISIVT